MLRERGCEGDEDDEEAECDQWRRNAWKYCGGQRFSRRRRGVVGEVGMIGDDGRFLDGRRMQRVGMMTARFLESRLTPIHRDDGNPYGQRQRDGTTQPSCGADGG
jgi:hypothetical protein